MKIFIENYTREDIINIFNYYYDKAEIIYFNILFDSADEESFISIFKADLIFKKEDKYYSTNKMLKVKSSQEVHDYILKNDILFCNNNFIEDISMFKEENEIFATITHEKYIIIHIEKIDLSYIQKLNISYNLMPYH
ncbi:hypothetical protein [Apibacter sp. HY039]|uniref:hypothetical protein n=1 Tax=Apibacter sp. HY039 TaxID=2501476 RepID=UPI000FEBA388|nr:hypothetical protein [Apibacter sp. HY039]